MNWRLKIRNQVLKSLQLSLNGVFAFSILIDPGHGGVDTGTQHNSIKESELVLAISKKLHALLKEKTDWKVSFTRTTDKEVSLNERVSIAKSTHPDLFLSIHANSTEESHAKGLEFFFQNSLPPDEESLLLVELENKSELAGDENGSKEISRKSDVKSIIEDLGRQGRIRKSLALSLALQQEWKTERKTSAVIKQAPFYVLVNNNRPAVLMEVGFISNAQEALLLRQESYQKNIAEKIYKALKKYQEKL